MSQALNMRASTPLTLTDGEWTQLDIPLGTRSVLLRVTGVAPALFDAELAAHTDGAVVGADEGFPLEIGDSLCWPVEVGDQHLWAAGDGGDSTIRILCSNQEIRR